MLADAPVQVSECVCVCAHMCKRACSQVLKAGSVCVCLRGRLNAEYRFDAINCPYNLISQSVVIMGHALPPPYDAASLRAPPQNKSLAISDLTGQDKSTSQCGIIFSFGFVSPGE